jgi:hypothetical protein
MRVAIAVNLPMEPVGPESIGTEGVDALRLTLARESRHIVAFGLSGTTSRAAVVILTRPVFGVNARARIPRPARAKGFCPQGF